MIEVGRDRIRAAREAVSVAASGAVSGAVSVMGGLLGTDWYVHAHLLRHASTGASAAAFLHPADRHVIQATPMRSEPCRGDRVNRPQAWGESPAGRAPYAVFRPDLAVHITV
ncbi:hypothetical protein GCM10010365_12750 [Streptomyces poonensis]|uniref:Uncharacterized protein n=1 Tax=Streptomyces poonensis TaxID=68255 RepID=A0A918PA76_9ACTN|nr:hypothetical protein GCM10010365_12750 [Streptomyces poonensis]GLJ88806.1 hypothetical protein GCM10017589_14060 [Streptomyces poonensis]